jgi:ABC-2 type transport system permease protein
MTGQARAILWAQVRALLNYGRRSGFAISFGAILFVLWYGIFAALAVLAGRVLATPEFVPALARRLPAVLFGAMVYWQIVPVLMAATGYALDLRKVVVYPVPHRELFQIDLLLRGLTSLEMLILTAGAVIGSAFNPALPKWGILGFVAFAAFNILVASGIKELLARALARRRFRELFTFLFVLVCALPQLVIVTKSEDRVIRWLGRINVPVLPWSAAAAFVEGRDVLVSMASVAVWVAAAYFFGRSQFERTLRFDADAARASATPALTARRPGLFARFARWPSAIFRDPLAALIEKELRFLSRAPRFRLVFVMGFSFGLLIWIPVVMNTHDGFMAGNYLVLVSGYALLLLGDVCFWNTFGFDRSAAQVYLSVPVRFQTVLVAKNIAAFFFILLEVVAIAAASAVIRMPVSPMRVLEALSVIAVLSLYLMGGGNLTSTHSPRASTPQKATRSGAAAKSQLMFMFLYPVAAAPVALAYIARWSFETENAFFLVLAITGVIGFVFYRVALDSAVTAVRDRREQFVTALAQGEGPIG